jgi:FkbM family methyltransferase
MTDLQQRPKIHPVVAAFAPYQGEGTPGFFTDFLGVKTRLSSVPVPREWDGKVFGYPVRHGTFHDFAEWVGCLRSVLEARDSFVAVELGAGWGPWIVTAGEAARQRGIRDIKLAGVEGSKQHVSFMRQHLIDNGFDPDAHFIFEGVVGPRDGTARFPVVNDAFAEWGHAADFSKARSAQTEEVPCIALNTLLERYPRVDFLHVDIQGSEHAVLRASRRLLQRKVRRIVIGTHRRQIEDHLFQLFTPMGWHLEEEAACVYTVKDGQHYLKKDGYQTWRNPRLKRNAL